VSTLAQLINRTQRQLLSGVVEERNKLATALTATGTSISFQYELNGIRAGSIVQVNSELMYVWEVNTGSKTAEVERAFNGTVAAAHLTSAYVIVNPRFPRHQILEAINDELSDLSSPMNGLFRVKSIDINYNGSDRMINFPVIEDVIDLTEVRIRYLSTDYLKVPKVALTRNLPTSDFGSGIALTINQTVRSGILRVSYKTGFSRLINESDDVQALAGYPLSAEDILVIGAQIRLVSPREIKRNFTESQGEPRRAEEVTPGAVGSSITNLLRMRRDRITAEAAKLNRQYPVMLSKA
jgi:hypothetical protein